jgi:hypothetical protein
MALTVDGIVTRVGDILSDAAHTRWPVLELVRYISDGQRRVVEISPVACTKTQTVALTVGQTRVQMPTGFIRIVDVIRNNNAAGTAPGRIIRKIDRATLDEENVNWHVKPTQAYVENYVYDPDIDDGVFYVSPVPNTSGQAIDAVMAVDLPDVTTGGALTIDAMYHEPLIDYVISRCLQKDYEVGNEQPRAQMHAQFFMQGVSAAGKNSNAA